MTSERVIDAIGKGERTLPNDRQTIFFLTKTAFSGHKNSVFKEQKRRFRVVKTVFLELKTGVFICLKTPDFTNNLIIKQLTNCVVLPFFRPKGKLVAKNRSI